MILLIWVLRHNRHIGVHTIVAGESGLFCSASRKKFQRAHAWRSLNVVVRFLLGWREIIHPRGYRGWAGSSSNFLETSDNPPCFFLVLHNEQGVPQTIQPTSRFLLGSHWALPLTNPFPGPTRVSCPLSNLILSPDFSRLGSASLYHLLAFSSHASSRSSSPVPCWLLRILLCHLVSTVHVLSRGVFSPPPSHNLVSRFSWLLGGLSLLHSPLECVHEFNAIAS